MLNSQTKVKSKNSLELSDKIIIAGLDEVGRGPWAGPIVACVYVEMSPVTDVKISDSKKLNEAQREEAYAALIKAGEYGIGYTTPAEIDQLGLSRANRLAFQRAISDLKIRPDLILIDGKDKIDRRTTLNIPFKTFIKGDLNIRAISCASIIAKVTRDRLMSKMAKKYPKYAFEDHKGYGTPLHKKLLKEHGACEIHRKSFKPVQALLQTSLIEELI
ncbi:ribonuclease HII [Candidatus Peregrinibacteria bacterium]|nr:ribonuclease HII [Candidatus Peregrinibacteria bacterium]